MMSPKYMGFYIRREVGTWHDGADQWYVDDLDDKFQDRSGSGFRTLDQAKQAVEELKLRTAE